MADPVLQAQALTRRFGGLAAVDGVTLAVAPGTVHAVIGPNGAGKTTLLNLLSGDLKPTAGHVCYRGRDVTALPADRRARLGIGRSYQRSSIFPGLTVAQNGWVAARAAGGSAWPLLTRAVRYAATVERAGKALALVGLDGRAAAEAQTLSHGEQRQLELAMILATEPALLLLDEPLAGMSPEEGERVVALIGRLKQGRTIVLIEHDMDAVFQVADVITVMVDGRVLESGPPAAIRASPAVRQAYLGEPGP